MFTSYARFTEWNQGANTKSPLVQMRCGPEPEENFRARGRFHSRRGKERRARSFACRSLFRSQYFCQTEDHANFELAEEIPGPIDRRARRRSRGELERCDRRLAFRETQRRPLSQHRGRSSTRTENCSASIARCTSRTIRFTTRNFISRRAISDFRAWETAAGQDRRLRLLGPMVSRGGAPNGACTARRSFFIRRPSAGIRERKRNSARRSILPGKRSSAATPSRTAATSPSPNRVGHEAPAGGDGIEFWGQSFICGPDGEIIAKGSVDREEIVMAEIEWTRVNEHRTHWPFLRDRRIDAYAGLEQRCSIRVFISAEAAVRFVGHENNPLSRLAALCGLGWSARSRRGCRQKPLPYFKPPREVNVTGTVTFTATGDSGESGCRYHGLTPGKHGFHIHENGDCSAPDGRIGRRSFQSDPSTTRRARHGRPPRRRSRATSKPTLPAKLTSI